MQFVNISPDLYPYLGTPKGTRIYRREGSQEEVGRWHDAVTAAVGPTISLGSVQMYCPVSRPALHERIARGNLTVFEFTVIERRVNFLGTSKAKRKEPYSFVPISECRSWRKDIEERAKEKGMSEKQIAEANSSQFDELDELATEEEKRRKKSKSAMLEVPLNQHDIEMIEGIAKDLQYESGGKYLADLLRPIIDGGFSALSCTKSGLWMMHQFEKHNTGKVPTPKFIKKLKALRS